MSLVGTGAVAIWHDIAPEGRAEFYAWHGIEHMPERVGIDGFLRGRRYIAIDGKRPEYFNLYETESPAALTGPAYLERLNHPTAWTIATVKHFRGVARSLCAVEASHGEGQGGLIATLRYAVEEASAPAHRRSIVDDFLPRLAAQPNIAGCHLLVADASASAVETAEKKVRAEANLIPRWIVLVESWGDAEPFKTQCAALVRDAAFADTIAPLALGVYGLQNALSKSPGART
jgi:hypothetical protein